MRGIESTLEEAGLQYEEAFNLASSLGLTHELPLNIVFGFGDDQGQVFMFFTVMNPVRRSITVVCKPRESLNVCYFMF